MKKLLLFACFAPAALFGQDSTQTQKKFLKIISVSAYGGGNIYRDGYEDRTIFQQAVPGSPLMFADLSGYNNEGFFFYSGGVNVNTSSGLQVSAKLRCQKKYSELRLGLNHSIASVSSQYYQKQTTTFVGSSALPGGELLYTDSVHNSSYAYNWSTDIISLELSWIVKSDPGKILSCYTGFGLSGGIGYNGVISAQHSESSYFSNRSDGPSNLYYSSGHRTLEQSYERYRAPMVAQFGGYIPIGLNLRLGKRHSFFSHLMLFGEYQGAMYALTSPGMNTKLRTSSNIYGGVRYYVHAPRYTGKHRNRRDGGHRDQQEYRRGDGMVH